jgi:hypothetical protein
MKNIFISLFLLVPVLIAGAQTTCNIKKAYAFYTVSMPGMQMADENGNPIDPKPDIRRFIYIEWSGIKDPQIETVLYNNKPLPATITPVKGNTVIPGDNYGNNKDYKISSKKGNSLWRIELQPEADNSTPGQGCKNIIIKTKGTKVCSFKLIKETQLMTLPRA